MKKLLFLLLITVASYGQTNTGTFKTGKLRLDNPDRTIDTLTQIVVRDSITLMTKVMSRKDFLKGISSGSSTIPTLQQVTQQGPNTNIPVNINVANGINPGLTVNSVDGNGININSINGVGAYITSQYNHAIEPTSVNYDAVHANSTNGNGVYAKSINGDGVRAFSTEGDGVRASSINGFGVYGFSNDNSAAIFDIPTANTSNIAEFKKENVNQATISHDGVVTGKGFKTPTGTGANVLLDNGTNTPFPIPLGFTPENIANKQNTLAVDATNTKYPTVTAVNTELNLKANDLDVVHKTGNETISGTKTFSNDIDFLANKKIFSAGSAIGFQENYIDFNDNSLTLRSSNNSELSIFNELNLYSGYTSIKTSNLSGVVEVFISANGIQIPYNTAYGFYGNDDNNQNYTSYLSYPFDPFAPTNNNWTLPTQSGTIALTSDIPIPLGFTPYNATNPSGYISSYTEIDAIVKAVNGLVKSNGTTISAAIANTDYALPNAVNSNYANDYRAANFVAGTNYQAPISLTTTGTSGVSTLVGNTLNIPDYTGNNNWTKTGDNIRNNNIGDTQIKIEPSKKFQFFNTSNTPLSYFSETGVLRIDSGVANQYAELGPQNLYMQRLQANFSFALGNPQINQAFSLLSTNYFGTSYVAGSAEVSGSAVAEHSFNIGNSIGDGITSGIFRIGRTRLQSTVPVKYATDLSGSYDNRSLIDRGFAQANYKPLNDSDTNVSYANEFLIASATANDVYIGAAISAGTNASSIVNLTGNNPGVVRMTSSTTANSGYRWQTDLNTFFFKGGESFTAIINPLSFTTTTTRLGFVDTNTSADAVDGAYVEMSNSGVLILKTSNNSVRTTSATVATLSLNTWYKIKINVNANATAVIAEVYDATGTLLGTQSNTSNIPITSARAFGSGIVTTNSGVVATALMDLDFLRTNFTVIR